MTAVARKQLPLRPAGPDTVDALLAWYDAERRDLPWRVAPRQARRSLSRLAQRDHAAADDGESGHPLSTSASSPAGRRSQRSPRRRSTTCSPPGRGLATTAAPATCTNAPCAVAREYGGVFPIPKLSLQQLPGIGPYTAAAIAAIAFNEWATAGRRQHRTGRLAAFRDAPAASRRQARIETAGGHADAIASPRRFRAGDDGSGRHDLHAEASVVPVCPLQTDCHAHYLGIDATLPAKAGKTERPSRYGFAFVALREDGRCYCGGGLKLVCSAA